MSEQGTSKAPILIALGLVVAAGVWFGVTRYRDATDQAGFGVDQCGGLAGADPGPLFGDDITSEMSVVLTGPTAIPLCVVAPEGAELRSAEIVLPADSRIVTGQPTADTGASQEMLASVRTTAAEETVSPSDERPVQVIFGWMLGCSGNADLDTRETVGSVRVSYRREGIDLTAVIDSATDYEVTVPASCDG